MTFSFAWLNGLGYVNYVGPLLGLQQAERIVLRHKPFGLAAHLALGAVGADASCFIAWFTGKSDIQTIGFGEVLAVCLVPFVVATAIIFWIKKYRTVSERYNVKNSVFCSDETDVFNYAFAAPAIALAGVFLFIWLPFAYGVVRHQLGCSSINCMIGERLFGGNQSAYSYITLVAFSSCMFVSTLFPNLFTVYKNRSAAMREDSKRNGWK